MIDKFLVILGVMQRVQVVAATFLNSIIMMGGTMCGLSNSRNFERHTTPTLGKAIERRDAKYQHYYLGGNVGGQ